MIKIIENLKETTINRDESHIIMNQINKICFMLNIHLRNLIHLSKNIFILQETSFIKTYKSEIESFLQIIVELKSFLKVNIP